MNECECTTQARAERDALRADAERYRWLRDANGTTMVVNENIGHDWDRVMNLDAAIDAALAKEKQA